MTKIVKGLYDSTFKPFGVLNAGLWVSSEGVNALAEAVEKHRMRYTKEGDALREKPGWYEKEEYVLSAEQAKRLAKGGLVALEKMDTKPDMVQNPPHYNAYKGLEIIDLAEQMNFNRGNVVKYVARAGLKDPDAEIEDLSKARWYLDREIERLSRESSV